ncbi:MAG TPA: zinc dependent phospholipase C family protein [Terriglobia bacterium]|nr:zinc dependent phospholipase C family protein [Terriglobia bacterium]
MMERLPATARSRIFTVVLFLLFAFCSTPASFGYSILTHEAIIDAEWDGLIKASLSRRFPGATAEQLREAHAYAYGGCVIQDMGYYPFGSRFFSHLAHYVRSGDFVSALLAESGDLNEFAFALGALSHYVADNQGHDIAVNRAVPLLYPKMRNKYGNRMTWEQDPEAHVLTEFGYDVLEVVAMHNAPQTYRDWVGFKVAKPLLERAFKKTYGLEFSDEFLNVDLTLYMYRKLASQFIPEMTEVAWALRRRELENLASGVDHQKMYHLSRKSYLAWRGKYTRPGPVEKLTAFFFRLIPKFGLLNSFDFHAPTVQTERLFAESLRATILNYDLLLRALNSGGFSPANVNLDTGRPSQAGEYLHCDLAYAQLLNQLERGHFAGLNPELRDNLLRFYNDPAENALQKRPRRWRKVQRELNELEDESRSEESASQSPPSGQGEKGWALSDLGQAATLAPK